MHRLTQNYRCFNEAGAFLLRKRNIRVNKDKIAVLASMKPEHFCSGNDCDGGLVHCPDTALQ